MLEQVPPTVSPPQLMAQAADLNIQGVNDLASGKISEALEVLAQSLLIMKQAAIEYSALESSAAGTASSSFSEPVVAEDNPPNNNVRTQINNVTSNNGEVEEQRRNGSDNNNDDNRTRLSYHCIHVEVQSFSDDQFHIYNRAVIFDPIQHDSLHVSLDIKFYSLCILFNVALCQHLRSKLMMGSMQRYPALEEATLLYASCSNFLKGFLFHSRDSLMLLVGSLNNEAHIHHELLKFEKTQMITEQLAHLVGQAYADVSRLRDDEREHVENISLNIFTARQSSAFAPCA